MRNFADTSSFVLCVNMLPVKIYYLFLKSKIISIMCSPVNNISLDDLSFYIDERLSKVNVYNITLISDDINLALPCIIQLMHKYSKSQMIQECDECHAKVTFISSIPFNRFGTYFDRVLDATRLRYGLDSESLFYT